MDDFPCDFSRSDFVPAVDPPSPLVNARLPERCRCHRTRLRSASMTSREIKSNLRLHVVHHTSREDLKRTDSTGI